MLKLYEFAPTRSLRPLWALQELQLTFEAITVNLMQKEHLRPEFLALNPAGKLPVLVDGETVITESAAIVLYLCEKHGLWPATVAERAQLYRWVCFAITELEQPLWRMSKQTKVEADQPVARQEFLDMAAVLEKHLQGRTFVLGEELSAADFVLAYTLDWANELRLLADFPACRAYLERLYARPRAPRRIAAAFKSLG